MKKFIKKIYDDKFQRYTVLIIILLAAFLIFENSLDMDITEGRSPESFQNQTIIVPLIGEIDPLSYSIPALTVILGLVDGFNPCAMWVLVYLIALVAGMNDRRKVWIIVGSFVLASGILYFLFMTACLYVFLLIGYIRPVMIMVGLIALWMGAVNLRDYFKKEDLVCDVGDATGKKKTVSKIRDIVMSPLSFATVLAIIALAFLVNSVEFACSSAIPAIYTGVLANSGLSPLQHYLYILLYVFFFMLDDLIIFAMAAFAVQGTLGQKYAKYCKLIGGIVMLLLGVMLVFFPGLLG